MCHHQPETAWDEHFEFEAEDEVDREEATAEAEERLEDKPVPTPSD